MKKSFGQNLSRLFGQVKFVALAIVADFAAAVVIVVVVVVWASASLVRQAD